LGIRAARETFAGGFSAQLQTERAGVALDNRSWRATVAEDGDYSFALAHDAAARHAS